MHDELNAIRRLYGESGTEGDLPETPTESENELEALASMKAALDRLPPQRPDASVIDAVVAAAGEATRAAALGPIRVVYDEEPEPLASEQAVAEAATLAEMKAALDALPRQRPDASVIDAVVAAATAPARPAPAVATVRAADRPAERPARRRVVAALSAVFAVVLVFGGGLWLNRDAATPQEVVADRFEMEEDVVVEEPLADEAPLVAEAPVGASTEALSGSSAVEGARERVASNAPPPSAVSANRSAQGDDVQVASARRAAPASAPSAGVPSAVAPPTANSFADVSSADAEGLVLASEKALPLADGDEELQLLYLRVREMQAAQAGLGWDTPPVSLGAAPDSTPAATGWMQVRVER